jgi:hypothetical protein
MTSTSRSSRSRITPIVLKLPPTVRPAVNRFPDWIVADARRLGINYGVLRVTQESQYSCLMPYQIPQVTDIFTQEVGPPPSVVIDATANVGCDTINFRRMWPSATITALEVDAPTHHLLQQNMDNLDRVLSVKGVAPVTTVNVNCVAYLSASATKADLVYFDIPWGGPEYYKAPSMKLVLDGRPLGEIVRQCLTNVSPLVVIKVPVNADMEEFRDAMTTVAARFSIHDVVKPKGNIKGNVAYRLVFARLQT